MDEMLSAQDTILGVLAELKSRLTHQVVVLRSPISQVVESDYDDHRIRHGIAYYERVTVFRRTEAHPEWWAVACHAKTSGYPAQNLTQSLIVLPLRNWSDKIEYPSETSQLIYERFCNLCRRQGQSHLLVFKALGDGTLLFRSFNNQLTPETLSGFTSQKCLKQPYNDCLSLFETVQPAKYQKKMAAFLADQLLMAIVDIPHFPIGIWKSIE